MHIVLRLFKLILQAADGPWYSTTQGASGGSQTTQPWARAPRSSAPARLRPAPQADANTLRPFLFLWINNWRCFYASSYCKSLSHLTPGGRLRQQRGCPAPGPPAIHTSSTSSERESVPCSPPHPAHMYGRGGKHSHMIAQ